MTEQPTEETRSYEDLQRSLIILSGLFDKAIETLDTFTELSSALTSEFQTRFGKDPAPEHIAKLFTKAISERKALTVAIRQFAPDQKQDFKDAAAAIAGVKDSQ